ncbi:MAG: hypothetical protein LBQ35_04970, partial [Spirochaetaceae bacterium]|nr:hypothetical protein [Spirochaetaceae bacterium]
MKKCPLSAVLIFCAGISAFAQTGGPWPEREEGIALREEAGAGMSAAHALLPLGARVRVLNTENDRSVVVTVESLLDETANRLIALSPEAADSLGMEGSAWVRVDLIDSGDAPEGFAPEAPAPDESAGPQPVITLAPAGPRAPPESPAGEVRRILPGSADQVVIRINKLDRGDWEVSIGSGEAPHSGATAARPAPADSSPASAFPPNPAPLIQAARRAALGPASVIPGIPAAGSQGRYRLQAGSFLNQAGADRALVQVQAAGYTATLERYNQYIRV